MAHQTMILTELRLNSVKVSINDPRNAPSRVMCLADREMSMPWLHLHNLSNGTQTTNNKDCCIKMDICFTITISLLLNVCIFVCNFGTYLSSIFQRIKWFNEEYFCFWSETVIIIYYGRSIYGFSWFCFVNMNWNTWYEISLELILILKKQSFIFIYSSKLWIFC